MEHRYCYPTVRPLPDAATDPLRPSEIGGYPVVVVSGRLDHPAATARPAAPTELALEARGKSAD